MMMTTTTTTTTTTLSALVTAPIIAWEPIVTYPEDRISVRKEIIANPYLAVLGTMPTAENANKVRNILSEAKQPISEQGLTRFGSHEIMLNAEHRHLWALWWLQACGEAGKLANATAAKPPTIQWEPKFAYSSIKTTVIEDIKTMPHMAVLGTVPHTDGAEEVRFILKSAQADATAQRLEREGCYKRLTSAENRINWATKWLSELESE
jgi:hypothetical protein